MRLIKKLWNKLRGYDGRVKAIHGGNSGTWTVPSDWDGCTEHSYPGRGGGGMTSVKGYPDNCHTAEGGGYFGEDLVFQGKPAPWKEK